MGIKPLHYLTMDDVFHCLAAYGGEGIRPVVCRVTLVSLLKYWCDEGFFSQLVRFLAVVKPGRPESVLGLFLLPSPSRSGMVWHPVLEPCVGSNPYADSVLLYSFGVDGEGPNL